MSGEFEFLQRLSEELGDLRRRVGRLERQERGPTGIRARVYNSSNITISTGVFVTLTFDSEREDTDGLHSTVSNTGRLTAPVAGWYVIMGNARIEADGTGARALRVLYNGSDTLAQDNGLGDGTYATILDVGTQFEMAAGDYVELQAYQNSGGDLDVVIFADYSPEFMMVRVG